MVNLTSIETGSTGAEDPMQKKEEKTSVLAKIETNNFCSFQIITINTQISLTQHGKYRSWVGFHFKLKFSK